MAKNKKQVEYNQSFVSNQTKELMKQMEADTKVAIKMLDDFEKERLAKRSINPTDELNTKSTIHL